MSLQLSLFTKDQQVIDLCIQYWQLDADDSFLYKVSDLDLPQEVSLHSIASFVRENCNAYDPEITCTDCGEAYSYKSRSDYEQHLRQQSEWMCEECQQARIEYKRALQKAAEDEKQSLIQRTYGANQRIPIVVHKSISFREAVSLLALLRLNASEDLSMIHPVDPTNGVYAPTTDLAINLLKLLHKSNLIKVHPSSPLNAFDADINTFYLFRVKWWSPIDENGNTAGIINDVESIFRNRSWPIEWYDDAYRFWCEIALHECLQYLQMCLVEHGFEFTAGDKTKQMFDNVLKSYSISQVYSFIWRAAKDAAAYYMRDRVSKAQAANSVVGSIQRMADKASAAKWDIDYYRRDRRSPESMVSHVMYHVALALGDRGIDHIPYSFINSLDACYDDESNPLE